MPQYHAEVLVRVFTKEPQYFAVIQAGFRTCLQEVNQAIEAAAIDDAVVPLHFSTDTLVFDDEMPIGKNTPPQMDIPSTPPRAKDRTFSRQASLSFTNNSFTTVSLDFIPTSPSRGARKNKRRREASEDTLSDSASLNKKARSD
jgi:deoxynucleoside triphosphate triphosphohydrolase SAMHD1